MQSIRRKEFIEGDPKEIQNFLDEMSFGCLACNSESVYPQITPLNFVYLNQSIYFHSSLKGHKMALIAEFPDVTFAVTDEYAIIPSWFSNPVKACPATSFFKSVIVYGKASIVENNIEKAGALQAFMEKLQPEGRFAEITPDSDLYKNDLKSMAVIRIDIEKINAKFKFGQNLSETKFNDIVEKLEKRNLNDDPRTVAAMKSRCPHKSKKQ